MFRVDFALSERTHSSPIAEKFAEFLTGRAGSLRLEETIAALPRSAAFPLHLCKGDRRKCPI